MFVFLFSVSSRPDQLHEVEVPIVSNAQCRTIYHTKIIDDAYICAGGKAGEDSCQVKDI